AGAQSLKFTLVDADGNSLSITYVSDNTSLFANENISFTGVNVNSDTNVVSSAATVSWITVTVTPTAEASGTGNITITVTDSTSKTARQTVMLTVNTINDTPTITMPSNQSTNEESLLTLESGNAISITDVDAAGGSVQLTLTSMGGTIALTTTSNLTINSGINGTAFINVTGTITAINTALDGLSFTPTTDFSGTASITINVNDLGNTGPDGNKSASSTLTITVNGINDAPVVSGPSTQTTNEDTIIIFSSGNSNSITVVDVDALTDPIQTTVTVTNGVISLAQNTGLTITNGSNNSASIEFSGTVANINLALEGLTFTPTTNYFGTATLTVEVDDQGYNGTGNVLTDSNATTITITSVNDSPVIGSISNQATNRGTITSSISFTITDAESGVLTVSCSSSDAAIVSSTSFDIGQTGANSYTTTISAGGTASVSMTIMPSATGTGVATITAMVTDSSGVTATSQFDLTVYDIPSVSWASATQTITETSTTISIPLNLSAASGQPVSVSYTFSGTATDGVDYSYTTTSITIPAGDLAYSVSVTINNNNIFEGDETIILSITSAVNAVAGSITEHTITIDDDSDQPTVSWSPATQSIAESAGSANLTLVLSSTSDVDAIVGYTITGGTASGNNVDYTLTYGTVRISAGSTTASITCSIINDTVDEDNETVLLSFNSYSNVTAGTATDYTLTIEDNDAAPTIAWTSTAYSATENAGTLVITATLSAISSKEISFAYTSGGGTASASDYTLSDSELIISAGSQSITLSIEINDDTLFEVDETILVCISAFTNTTAGGITQTTVNIIDNESDPTISWQPSDVTVSESSSSIEITATMSSISGLNSSVSYTVSGTASSGNDYTLANGTLTIPAGSLTGTVLITLGDDNTDEDTEFVYVQMVTYTNTTAGSNTIYTLNITDDDNPPTISFSPTSYSLAESSGTVYITATLSSSSEKSISVDYSVTGGTATLNTDYTLTDGTLTITAGNTTASFTCNITDDSIDESLEIVNVELGNFVNVSAGATTAVSLSIVDNDASPSISWNTSGETVTENSGSVTFTATLATTSGQNVSFAYTVTPGTATSGDDYTLSSGELSISAGSQSVTLQVLINDDSVFEQSETLSIQMSTYTNATAGATTSIDLTITDNESLPTITWSPSSSSVSENSGSVQLTATLSAVSGLASSIDYTVGGTASNGEDYTLADGVLTIPAGSQSINLTLNLGNDGKDEDNEIVYVRMTNYTNTTSGVSNEYTLTITDDDDPPTISFSPSSYSASESAGTLNITATLSIASEKAISVDYSVTGGTATSGVDYTTVDGTLNISAGATQATFTCTIIDDSNDEDTETVYITLSNYMNSSAGASTVYTLNIGDNDNAPTVTWNTSAITVAENAGSQMITASLSGTSGKNISFAYTVTPGTATSGVDYTLSSGELNLAAGTQSVTALVMIADDSIYENNETLSIQMSSYTNTSAGATTSIDLTITDDETTPTITWNPSISSVLENSGTVQITATLSSISGLSSSIAYTVGGTATSGTDYTLADGTLTISAGTQSTILTITLGDDGTDENDEVVYVRMNSYTNTAAGSSNEYTLTITDDDSPPTISFSPSSYSASESSGTLNITATLSSASGKSISVDYSVTGGSATLGTDYTLINNATLNITAGSTQASFTCSITNDTNNEIDETVDIQLGNYINVSAGTSTAYALTIGDDDSPPTVSWNTGSASVTEASGSLVLTATLSGTSGQNVSFAYTVSPGTATSDVDYTLNSGILIIAAGSQSVTLSMIIVDDSVYENSETLTVQMSSYTNTTAGATTSVNLTITDNETAPTITWSPVSSSVSESGGSVQITATLSASSGMSSSIAYTVGGTATSGSDYTLADGTLTISAGQTTGTVTITVGNDATDEDSETVLVRMVNYTNTTSESTANEYTLTITDDDDAPSISFTPSTGSISESGGTATITATLSLASEKTISVGYTSTGGTATSGSDYTLNSGTLSFSVGATSQTFTATIGDDSIDEDSETVIVGFSSFSNVTETTGSGSSYTLTITDNDDSPTIAWTSAT
ncbi:Na-Ca exchanger/integrin-beta4 domain protein, partial [Candidatus Magnetomorum sp. HK-1]